MSTEHLEEIREQTGSDGPRYDLLHLQHVMEGYRARIAEGPGYEAYHHPGGTRDLSFRLGVEWAERDMVAPIPQCLVVSGHPETMDREIVSD